MPREIDIPVIPTAVGAALGYWVGKSTPLGSTLGMIAGGFGGYFIGKRTPQMAKVHFQNPKRKNPGAKWHEDRTDDLRMERRKYFGKNDAYSNARWGDLNSRVIENESARSSSLALGIPNPRATKIQLRRIMQEASRLRKSGMHKRGALKNAWRLFGPGR